MKQFAKWYSYDKDNLVVDQDIYDSCDIPQNCKESLKRQAESLDSKIDNYIIFLSGGIDSQTKAYGFVLAGIKPRCVFLKLIYRLPDGSIRWNKEEFFYASLFTKEHNLKLEVFEAEFDEDRIQDVVLQSNYFNNTAGTGIMFFSEALRDFIKDKNFKGSIITGHSTFSMSRSGKICFGDFFRPDAGLLYGVDPTVVVPFDLIDCHVFRYYQYVHQKTKEIQILQLYEPKNLAYTELGFDFRHKFSGWEFLDTVNDYSAASKINFAKSYRGRIQKTPSRLVLDAMGIDSKIKRTGLKSVDSSVRLYEFETSIEDKFINVV